MFELELKSFFSRIVLGISVLLLVASLIVFFQRKREFVFYNINFNRIVVSDGQVGLKMEVTDSSAISEIAAEFATQEYRFVHQEKFTGYLYMLDFYSESEQAIRILVLSDKQIAVDDKVYESNQMLDLHCLEKLK